LGSNYAIDPLNPHIRQNTASSPVRFRYRATTSTPDFFATISPVVNQIDPNQYDLGNGLLAAVPSGHWTVQRAFLSPTLDLTLMYYGQRTYPTFDLAVRNFMFQPKHDDPFVVADGVFRCYIIVRESATSLSSTSQCQFFNVTKFGVTPYDPNFMLTLPPSSGSGDDANFVFEQIAPATTWDITHNLGKFPSVSVVDSGGNAVNGDVVYLNPNSLQVTFNSPFGGKVFLN
jgi:hypothetical protein